jgi:hypothetical protein
MGADSVATLAPRWPKKTNVRHAEDTFAVEIEEAASTPLARLGVSCRLCWPHLWKETCES